ncbi:MAG: alkaline phosphatase family protein [Polyangiaceae bacterium]|nr:alkaline phosphatase family protein [Polyangiaceae bacterium]
MRFSRSLAAAALVALAAPAAPRAETLATDAVPRAKRADFAVAFVALDGVRAQEVFGGPDRELFGAAVDESLPAGAELAPNLRALATHHGVGLGVPGRGPSFRASGPRYVSLPGYIEMLSGRSTACTHNGCDVSQVRTFLSEMASTGAVAAGEVVAFASWPRLESLLRDERGRVLVSAGRRRAPALVSAAADSGLERLLAEGRSARPAPGRELYRPDRFTAELALAWARHHRPKLLFLGLGDADEHAHRGNYAGYVAALRQADRVVGKLWEWLEQERARGRETLLVVTTDHGRARGFVHHDREPESGEVWLIGAGSFVHTRGVVELSRPGRLRDVVPSVRALLGLPRDRARRAGAELCGVFRACAK